MVARGDAVPRYGVPVELTDYPFFPRTMMHVDQARLDHLAAQHVTDIDGAPPSMKRFLFAAVPVALFDQIFASSDPGELPLASSLWLFHLSGYYGGVWLRGELAASGHNSLLASVSLPPTEEQFTTDVGRCESILEAAAGRDVLAYNERSLFDESGLVDTFGYNQGYLLQIVEKPPAGLSAPADFVTCPPAAADGPLYCDYRTSKLAALHRFDSVSRRLRDGDAAYSALEQRIAPLQEAAIARGRMVWDGQLDVQGFTQDAYLQLLDISSAFLETVQATALATVQAVAEKNELMGRQVATANAMMTLWLRSYLVGLTDGRPVSLPTFAT